MSNLSDRIDSSKDSVITGKNLIKTAINNNGGNVTSELPTFKELADEVSSRLDLSGRMLTQEIVEAKPLDNVYSGYERFLDIGRNKFSYGSYLYSSDYIYDGSSYTHYNIRIDFNTLTATEVTIVNTDDSITNRVNFQETYYCSVDDSVLFTENSNNFDTLYIINIKSLIITNLYSIESGRLLFLGFTDNTYTKVIIDSYSSDHSFIIFDIQSKVSTTMPVFNIIDSLSYDSLFHIDNDLNSLYLDTVNEFIKINLPTWSYSVVVEPKVLSMTNSKIAINTKGYIGLKYWSGTVYNFNNDSITSINRINNSSINDERLDYLSLSISYSTYGCGEILRTTMSLKSDYNSSFNFPSTAKGNYMVKLKLY